jgi:hypothetical protein
MIACKRCGQNIVCRFFLESVCLIHRISQQKWGVRITILIDFFSEFITFQISIRETSFSFIYVYTLYYTSFDFEEFLGIRMRCAI